MWAIVINCDGKLCALWANEYLTDLSPYNLYPPHKATMPTDNNDSYGNTNDRALESLFCILWYLYLSSRDSIVMILIVMPKPHLRFDESYSATEHIVNCIKCERHYGNLLQIELKAFRFFHRCRIL